MLAQTLTFHDRCKGMEKLTKDKEATVIKFYLFGYTKTELAEKFMVSRVAITNCLERAERNNQLTKQKAKA